MRWTRKSIIEEIKRLHAAGAELNYAAAEANHLNLVRAAAWHFGTWRRAVQSAGIDYESLSKYQRWDRQRIVERIRRLHASGADLSWRSVSLEIDPPLAAAALRPNGFPSWREAITAAGLDINTVARYQYWNKQRVTEEIQRLYHAQQPLSSKAIQSSNQPLFCAARRRFGSWDNALVEAGLDVAEIRLRRRALKRAARGSRGKAAAKAPAAKTATAKPSPAPGAIANGVATRRGSARSESAQRDIKQDGSKSSPSARRAARSGAPRT